MAQHIRRPNMAKSHISPANNAANISNANKGTSGQNLQRCQNQGNRGWQMNPQNPANKSSSSFKKRWWRQHEKRCLFQQKNRAASYRVFFRSRCKIFRIVWTDCKRKRLVSISMWKMWLLAFSSTIIKTKRSKKCLFLLGLKWKAQSIVFDKRRCRKTADEIRGGTAYFAKDL